MEPEVENVEIAQEPSRAGRVGEGMVSMMDGVGWDVGRRTSGLPLVGRDRTVAVDGAWTREG